MWNDGFYLLWSHITTLFYEDLDSGLKLLPKLTSDHIHLTPFSKMRVSLAAQVLSDSVSTVLKLYGSPESAATAEFILMVDKFFDCLNVRNTKEHQLKRKSFLQPYSSLTDPRFQWLDEFMQYFSKWKDSIQNRPGKFSVTDKSKMFISWQTYERLQITIHSFKEVCRYLLQKGVPYVLSERFCQDDLKNYFGQQRSMGRRRDNPNIRQVGYNDNTIKSLLYLKGKLLKKTYSFLLWYCVINKVVFNIHLFL